MIFIGTLSGLAAALFQSSGYVCSRIYVKDGGSPIRLMILAQLLLALFSLPLLALVWYHGLPGDWSWLLPLVGTAIGTTGGELMFFQAEKNIAPSRLSSLLGLRVAVLATVSATLGIEYYNLLQIGGIVLAVLSAVVMNYENGKLNFKGMGYVGGALCFYCLSDLSVKLLIDHIGAPSIWQSALLAVCIVNLLTGCVLLPFFLAMKMRPRQMVPALPYAGTWFAKQLFLYSCFAAVGPVFGNVIMTARGPISILLTIVLLHLGVRHLEKPKSGKVWLQRGGATLMMVAAIALYSIA